MFTLKKETVRRFSGGCRTVAARVVTIRRSCRRVPRVGHFRGPRFPGLSCSTEVVAMAAARGLPELSAAPARRRSPITYSRLLLIHGWVCFRDFFS